jgi:hypothetical protein
LNSSQCIVGYEKRSFHRAIIPPEPYSPSCGVVTAATVWKVQGHGLNRTVSNPPGSRASSHSEDLMFTSSDGIVAILVCCLLSSWNAKTGIPAGPDH